MKKEFTEIEANMEGQPFLLPVLCNKTVFCNAQVDSGCDSFAAVSEKFAQRLRLERVQLPHPRRVCTAVEKQQGAAYRRETQIRHLVHFRADVDGWEFPVVAYVIPGLTRDIILGTPWLSKHDIVLHANEKRLIVRSRRHLIVQAMDKRTTNNPTAGILGSVYAGFLKRASRDSSGFRFLATSLREINTSLANDSAPLTPEDEVLSKLPTAFHDFADLFQKEKANGLPPHRGKKDHHIRLRRNPDGAMPELPWAPLYNMPRDQLLEIRKQIVDLTDKGWIRASSSSAAAPVLLVKKAGGGWRFCVDYRALNKVTLQDRYPLPLIKETLRSLARAKWFTKLDVRSAFHRLRVAKGDEHLTAFRTRFGLFEWLVCPFGLAGAPATFQRYINEVLGDILDDYATAYLDDVLIYSSDSKDDHVRKTREVLQRLQDAGLYLDIGKCNFGVTEVKYLGFIVEAGREIRPDPEKIATIRTWEPPTRVKGVRSFLGFANFYREFIPKFSDLAGPLLALTKKGVPFAWSEACSNAFERLKAAFVSYPVLAQWDPDGQTVVEADSSGDAIGGCLSQYDAQGILHPVAYHSARLTAPQRNYTIHDKELLSIISCLKAWSAELRSVSTPFMIFTDHKNLEYFTAPRIMSERQARWAETLALFNFRLQYRPGSQASRPDALSRREQDMGDEDGTARSLIPPVAVRRLGRSEDRGTDFTVWGQGLPPLPDDHSDTTEDLETPTESEDDDDPKMASTENPPTTGGDLKEPTSEHGDTRPNPWPAFGTIDFSAPSSSWVLPNPRVESDFDVAKYTEYLTRLYPIQSTPQDPPTQTEIGDNPGTLDEGSPRGSSIFATNDLAELWDTGVVADTAYAPRRLAVLQGERKFPHAAATREQISNCSVDAHGVLQYKGRIWVPTHEPLTTALIQRVHDSPMMGHPGKNTTFQALRREYHWDGMSADVARFVRNCHCFGGRKSRQLRQGLLQPIPAPDRYWSQISVDFMTELPARDESAPQYMMVITDRLSKYIQLEAMTSMAAENCAERFKQCWWRFHGFPKQIISDRGSDWVGQFWTTLCSQVNTQQLLSTAHHPQTDGGTERANQEVQAVLRVMVTFSQYDWPDKLAACQVALNNRTSSVTGVSANRAIHGYDVDLIQRAQPATTQILTSPKGRADAFLQQLQDVTTMTQAAIDWAQQRQQDAANRSRRPAERFEVGDMVWLTLRNIKTNRPCKKLDWVMAKYKVIEVPHPLTVRLDVPRGIHSVFHVDLLERAATDPLPSQILQDTRPGPQLMFQDEDPALAEYGVEEILAAKNAPGRGNRRNVLVKWTGYMTPTWEPLENFTDTEALSTFEARWGDVNTNNGPSSKRRRVTTTQVT